MIQAYLKNVTTTHILLSDIGIVVVPGELYDLRGKDVELIQDSVTLPNALNAGTLTVLALDGETEIARTDFFAIIAGDDPDQTRSTPWVISTDQFRDRFTTSERQAIYQSSISDVVLARNDMMTQRRIDLTSQSTSDLLDLLITNNLFGADRKPELLAY
ncbi:hypothetical protein ACQZV8_13290 [Magnetococcales bacterium HHB-1]